MNRSDFFIQIRKTLFVTKMAQSQVDGISAILDEAEKRKTPMRHLAYILATAYHETAKTMRPVRETLASSDDVAIKRLETAWKKGVMPWVKKPYWRKDKDGKSWLGRGFPQLTHKENYERVGKAIGVDLVTDPSVAMQLDVATQVMFEGMEHGLFSGPKLADFLDGALPDYVGARRIVNGTEKATLIASYANEFSAALSLAHYGQSGTVSPQIPKDAPITYGTAPNPSGGWLAAMIEFIVNVIKGWKK